MKNNDPLFEKLADLKPETLLDTGCGCGNYISAISPLCGRITAVDISHGLIERCRREHQKSNITYLTMDGKNLLFSDRRFTAVMERGSLHHMTEWEKALDEMIRVSSRYILIAEPFDDLRNKAKKHTFYCHKFFTKVQNEAGYPHYEHIKPEVLLEYFNRKGLSIEINIVKSDKLIEFNEFFMDFYHFASKTLNRKDFINRFEELRRELEENMLCENDIIYIFAEKQQDGR